MQCPRCFGNDVSAVGSTHYVCNNHSCADETGKRTQFTVEQDQSICFPYDQIFQGHHGLHEFYRKRYLELSSVGLKTV